MKIVGIQAIPLSAPLAVPIGRSQNYSYTAKSAALAKVVTDWGVFGIDDPLTPSGPNRVHSGSPGAWLGERAQRRNIEEICLVGCCSDGNAVKGRIKQGRGGSL